MKNFFIYWIIFQLAFVGMAGGNTLGKIENNTFDCDSYYSDDISVFSYTVIGMIFPLVLFVNESIDVSVEEYCSAK
jgi:hypothetical protein